MPCSRSRSASIATSVHPDPEPRRFGLVKLRPAFLIQPGLRLRDVPRLDALLLDVCPVSFGAGDDRGRIDATIDSSLEFRARRLLWVREAAAVRVNLPKGVKLIIGSIPTLNPRFMRASASGASGRSMCIDRVLFIGLFWSVQCIT
jgi:hypothetical protein